MTPAASNRAGDSTGRDFAVRGPRGARRFQEASGNDVDLDGWDDEACSKLRESDANARRLMNSPA